MRRLGNLLILLSVFILVLTFWPIAKEEVKYDLNQVFHTAPVLTAPNKDFFSASRILDFVCLKLSQDDSFNVHKT